ncbi:hypothetical protein ABH935_002458 [Catenulispora sp. GAS73]|uniref:hypothetical protein n=1 Tax=Catenulispora sp. GAS73 TaxID=3156269 RepID=UPI00351306B4
MMNQAAIVLLGPRTFEPPRDDEAGAARGADPAFHALDNAYLPEPLRTDVWA